MRIQILILEFKGLKKLLKTLKDYINDTANKKGGTDGQTWEGLKWIAIETFLKTC